MANTIGYGQAAVNNTIGFGQGALTGSTPFSNTQSTEYDGMDAYVEVADADNLSFGNGTTDSPFSISAWIKPTSTLFRIFSKYQAPNYEYQFDVGSSGELRFYIFDGSTYRARTTFGSVISTGQWSHVAVTYSGVGGTNAQNGIKLYVNGVNIVGTTPSSGSYTAMSSTSAQVYIGKIASNYSNGNIDEVSVFNTELSASDVTSIYNGGVPNDISSLSPLSWWRFEGTGTTATDSGSGGNDGILDNTVVRSSDVPT